MLEGFDGDDAAPARARSRRPRCASWPATRPALAYWFWNADIVRWEALTGTPNVLVRRRGDLHAPRWSPTRARRYEYGINTDWLGRVVEAAGGQPLDAYFDEHILRPLGMEHTTFHPSDEQRANLGRRSTCTTRTAAWAATELDWTPRPGLVGRRPRPLLDRRATTCASSGCCSTAARSTARRSSSPRPSTPPSRNQIGDARLPARRSRPPTRARRADFNAGPGYKFGLGLLLQHRATSRGCARPAAAPGRASSTPTSGSTATTGVTGAIYTQTLPFVEPRRLPGLHRLRDRRSTPASLARRA